MDPDRQPDDRNTWVTLSRYSEIGFIIPSAVFLGFLLGKLLDRWLHTHWIYIAGVFCGAVLGFADMIRMAVSSTREKSGQK